MAKKLSVIVLVIALIFTTVAISPKNVSYAAKDVNDLRNDLNKLLKEKENAQKNYTNIEKEVNEVQLKINSLNYDISVLSDEISEIKAKLKKKQAELDEQEGNLDERLIAMYKKGSVGFVDVLLGSNSISEFVSNIKLLKLIHQYDQEVLETLQTEYEALNEIKAELDEKNNALSEKKKELTNQKSELKKKLASISDQIENYDLDIADVTEEILSLIDPNSEYVGGDFVWPLDAKYRKSTRIGSRWGMRIHPITKVWKMHGGTDIKVPTGSSIYACATGTVIKSAEYGGYGLCVMIDHGGGVVSLYAHCSKLICKKGDVVVAGEKIALVGMTGSATGPHLHFEVRINGSTVDSLQYFPDLYSILGP